MVSLIINADIEPIVFARKVVAAIISDQYGEYGAPVPAIASVQPQAPACVYELKALLQRSQKIIQLIECCHRYVDGTLALF